jgi:hypothetical protein
VNPDHLEPVTPAENTRRGLAGEMKTHCANGHPWTDENKMVNGRQSNGKFAHCCKVCHRERERARRIRNGS